MDGVVVVVTAAVVEDVVQRSRVVAVEVDCDDEEIPQT